MSNSVYQINKGINKSIEFKGLKAQYIWYLGVGLVALLILFAIIYIIGLNVFICLALIISLSTALFMYVYKMSRTYGKHGLMSTADMDMSKILPTPNPDYEADNIYSYKLKGD